MSKRARFVILLLVLGIGVWFIYPTINWYFLVPEDMQRLASQSRQGVQDYAVSTSEAQYAEIKQLRDANPAAAVPENFEFLRKSAEDYRKSLGLPQPQTWTVDEIFRSWPGVNGQAQLTKAIEAYHRDKILALKDMKRSIIQLGLDLSGGIRVDLETNSESLIDRVTGAQPTQTQISEAIDLAIEILKARIDQFGLVEPTIQKDELGGRIFVEIPGDNDPDRVYAWLLGKGSLRLQLVDMEAFEQINQFVANYRATYGTNWTPESEIQPDFIPAGSQIREYVKRDEYGLEVLQGYVVTLEAPEYYVDGSHITDARTASDNFNRPTSNFSLDAEGAEKMSLITRENQGKFLAIVMDGKVRAYATINGELHSQIMITGFSAEEADNIAKVLKTAALPIELEIASLEEVGASLGEDAIRSGLTAIIVGLIAVVAVIIVYYLGGGILASLGLIINMFLILATLSQLNLTLTLTAIAGLILTVGMAVDANVIVYERIKEEYWLGKSAAAAVKTGYSKALWAILDANITTIIAAIFLGALGSGPIKGFAVTLAVGVVFSVFSGLFVTRLFHDIGVEGLKRSRLSISWRRVKV